MKIIISGGGIAGMTAANLFHVQGHEVVVIDKAHEFTNAGFILSLKSFGVEIMREMGLEDNLRNQETLYNDVTFYRPNGNRVRQISNTTVAQKMSKFIFATRAAIHNGIYQSVKDRVQILMNTMIVHCSQNDSCVSARLSGGQIINADLLVIAEGLNSQLRSLFFSEARFEDFNIFYVAGRLTKKHNYPLGSFKTFLGVDKSISIVPLTENEIALQAYLNNTDDVEFLQSNSRTLLKTSFAEFTDEVQEIIHQVVENGILFTDKMGMIHSDNLVNGRVLLLGDAGYCPTAMSGMGASLSIYGAKALRHFMGDATNDLPTALNKYNQIMQPIIAKFQGNAKRNAGLFLPKSKFILWLIAIMFKIAPKSFIANKMSRDLGLTESQKKFEID